MAEKRRSVNTKFWDDSWISSLTTEEKLLYIYFLTSPLSNLLGIYEITLKRISYDTGLTQDKISKYLKSFERMRKAIFIADYIVLFNFIKNQSFNPKMETGARQLFSDLPNILKDKLKEYGIIDYDSLSNGIDSIEQKEKEKEYEKEYEKEIEKEKEINISFDVFWNLYPVERHTQKSKCVEYWNKLTDDERQLIIDNLQNYIKSVSETKYLKQTYYFFKEKKYEDGTFIISSKKDNEVDSMGRPNPNPSVCFLCTNPKTGEKMWRGI